MAMDWDALTDGFVQGFRLYQDYKQAQLQQEILKNDLERKKLELEARRRQRQREQQDEEISNKAASTVFRQKNAPQAPADQAAPTGGTQQTVPETGLGRPTGDTQQPAPKAAPAGQTGDDRLYQAEAIPVAPQSQDDSSPWPPVAARLGATPPSANVGAETAQAMGARSPEAGTSTTAAPTQAMETQTGVGPSVGSAAQAQASGTRIPKTGQSRSEDEEPSQLEPVSVLANDPHTQFHLERMRLAAERGNGALYQKYYGDYADHVAKSLTLAKNKAEHKLVALTSKLDQMRAQGQIDNLPAALKAAYLKAHQDYSRTVYEAAAQALYLYQNAATRPQGLKLLGTALDTEIKDIAVDGDFLVPLGKDGKPVTWGDGKPVRLHKDAAARMIERITPREPPLKVEPGVTVINPSGRVVFENKNNRPRDVNSNIQLAMKILSNALEVKTDAMGNLVAGTPPNIQRIYGELSMKAAKLIQGGMSPNEAAERVYKEYREAQAKFPNQENLKKPWTGGATTGY